MTEKKPTSNKTMPSNQKHDLTPASQLTNSGSQRHIMRDSYASRVSGQHLAGSGALVFEGELLEFPQWGSRAA